MGEHQWGQPDRNGIRACMNSGCAVRWWGGGRAWQERKGRRWVNAPLPACVAGSGPARCTHNDHLGIISKGRCNRHALPHFVVCEYHATPEALSLVILAMAAEIERLRSGGKQLPPATVR